MKPRKLQARGWLKYDVQAGQQRAGSARAAPRSRPAAASRPAPAAARAGRSTWPAASPWRPSVPNHGDSSQPAIGPPKRCVSQTPTATATSTARKPTRSWRIGPRDGVTHARGRLREARQRQRGEDRQAGHQHGHQPVDGGPGHADAVDRIRPDQRDAARQDHREAVAHHEQRGADAALARRQQVDAVGIDDDVLRRADEGHAHAERGEQRQRAASARCRPARTARRPAAPA